MRKFLDKNAKNIVIKVGTSILTKNGRFDTTVIENLAKEVSTFLKKGVCVSIVSSGAIGAGMTILKEKERPKTMEGLQAAAAVGQRYLMQCYEEAFSKHGFSTAQMLLTWDDFKPQNKRYMNAKRTLKEIQRRGLVPVINENDTVATDEIRFGDNDRLSALLSVLIEADLLIILSDTDGLRDPKGKRIEQMKSIGQVHIIQKKNPFTVGGMHSKLESIRMSTGAGIPVLLADGRQKDVLKRLIINADGSLGTHFQTQVDRGHARQNWNHYFSTYVQQHSHKKSTS